jgi:hypothetical protein
VEIFSAKIRVTPAAHSASVWVSSDWRTVEARATGALILNDALGFGTPGTMDDAPG